MDGLGLNFKDERMETKHTPGPWYALRGQRNISIRHKTGDKFLPMVNVASVRGKFPADCPYGSSEANARLIAAAPELLEALQAVLRSFPTDRDMRDAGWERAEIDLACRDYEAARAAISKALPN